MTFGLRFGGLASWFSGDATLNITTTSAAFLTGTRSSRNGRYGSTLGGHYIAIPGTSENHYFWFSQDYNGTQRGFDPGGFDSSLSDYSGHQVMLNSGTLTSIEVATSLESTMTGVYNEVSRTENVITITDTITPGSAFTGANWNSRGPAGFWGLHLENDISNDFAQNDSILSHALTPNTSGSIYVRACTIKIGSAFSDRLRLVLYQGGNSSTDPTGAELLYDFGQLSAGSSTDTWHTLFATGNIEITSGSDLWIGAISAGNGTTNVNYENSGNSRTGDFTASQTLFNADSSLGNNPGNAAPSTIPAGTTQTGFSYVIGMRLIYETTPIVGNGEWKQIYGVHVDADDMSSTTSFNANVFAGGWLPPPVSGAYIDYAEIAGNNDPTYRLGVYQGGVVLNPDEATLLWDGGRAPDGSASDWYRVTASNDTAEININEPIWICARGDGNLGNIRFDFGGGTAEASPPANPMDFPPNPEYEAPNANTNHSTDPDTSFESPFVRDAANDTTPGNIPGLRVHLVLDGFTLAEG